MLSSQTPGARPAPVPPKVLPAKVLPAKVLPATRGPRIVLLPAAGAPWAVVQLHVRTANAAQTDLWPHVPAFVAALAEGGSKGSRTSASARVHAAGGETRTWRSPDEVVVSDGVPAASLDEALRAMDQRLRTRRSLQPATAATTSPAIGSLAGPALPPDDVRAALAPEQAFGRPLAGAAPPITPEALGALATALLVRDDVVVVVFGGADEASLERLVRRYLRTTLSAGGAEVTAVVPPDAERVMQQATALAPARGPYSWLWLTTPGAAFLRDDERRGFALTARLLGGEAGFAAGLGWVSIHIPLTDPVNAPAAEAAVLARLATLAGEAPLRPDAGTPATAVPALVPARLERVVAAARGSGWRALAAPADLALAVGREVLLRGEPVPLVALYEGASADDIQAAARALLAAPRVVVRHSASIEDDK